MIQKIKVLQSEGRENGDLGLGLCEIGGEDKSSSPDATPRNHERVSFEIVSGDVMCSCTHSCL